MNSQNILEKLDKDVFKYRTKYIMFILLNIISIVIIGVLFNMVLESFIFILSYIPLRVYAGGYQDDTIGSCYIFSMALTVILMVSVKNIPPTNYIVLFLMLISSSIILIFAPVEDTNNYLIKMKIKTNKKIARAICIIEIIAILILITLKFTHIALTISLSLFIIALMLLFARV